jgi:hypothetical protein
MQSDDEAIDGLLNSSEVCIADNGVCSIILARCYVVAKVCKVLYMMQSLLVGFMSICLLFLQFLRARGANIHAVLEG